MVGAFKWIHVNIQIKVVTFKILMVDVFQNVTQVIRLTEPMGDVYQMIRLHPNLFHLQLILIQTQHKILQFCHLLFRNIYLQARPLIIRALQLIYLQVHPLIYRALQLSTQTLILQMTTLRLILKHKQIQHRIQTRV